GRPSEDPVAEAGGEALDLALDPARHVHRRAGRNVAVRPGGRPAGGRPAVVPRAVLDTEYERPIGVSAASDRPLRGRDLADRTAEVDGGRPTQAVGAPRDRAIEGPVDLEHTRPVAERLVQALRPR